MRISSSSTDRGEPLQKNSLKPDRVLSTTYKSGLLRTLAFSQPFLTIFGLIFGVNPCPSSISRQTNLFPGFSL